jgi:hypothetical protein
MPVRIIVRQTPMLCNSRTGANLLSARFGFRYLEPVFLSREDNSFASANYSLDKTLAGGLPANAQFSDTGAYFPHDRHSMIAAVVHFDDAPLNKGCVRVVPGSHKLGPLEHSPEGGWHLPFAQYPIESAVPCEAIAGDALFFSYLTIHGSGINTSDEARTTVLIQMQDPEDPPTIKTHESRGQGMILRGVDPRTLTDTR